MLRWTPWPGVKKTEIIMQCPYENEESPVTGGVSPWDTESIESVHASASLIYSLLMGWGVCNEVMILYFLNRLQCFSNT